MLMMRKFNLILFLLIFVLSPVFANINFGNKQSAFKVGSGATLNIDFALTVQEGSLIKKDRTSKIMGNDVTFDDGILESSGAQSLITAVYDPASGGDSIRLNGSKSIDVEPGTIYESLVVSGDYNRLEGQPMFRQDITLDANASLTLALQSKLNRNISMVGGGTLKLDDDLNFEDDRKILGFGTVFVNKRQIDFGGQDVVWTSSLYWNNASDMVLNSRVDLSSTWTFFGENHITGNGNILDLSKGATLWVKHDSILHLRDIKLRGLGSRGKIILEDESSQIRLSDSQVEMDRDWTVTCGGIYVDGESTIYVKNWILSFEQRGSMTVDGTCLWYDLLRQEDKVESIIGISPEEADDLNNQYIEYLNDGIIRQVIGGQHGDIIWEGVDYLHEDLWLSPDMRAIVVDDKVVFGRSHSIHFSRTDDTISSAPLIEITPGKKLTLLNIVFENFLPDQIGSGYGYNGLSPDSIITFSDKTTLELAKDCELNMTWTFIGTCILKGKGHTLKLGTNGGITVISNRDTDANFSSLLFDDINVEGISGNNIRCYDPYSTFSFNNAKWVLDANYALTEGAFDVIGPFELSGEYVFAYETNQSSTIWQDSSMIFDTGFTFSYAPSVNYRTLIEMTDDTSKIYMNGATLRATTTGLQLTKGTLVLDHKNYLYNGPDGLLPATLNTAIAFGDGTPANDLSLEIMPGGNIELMTGYLDYQDAA